MQGLPSDTGYETVTVAISASLICPLVRSSSVEVPAFVKCPVTQLLQAARRGEQIRARAAGPRSIGGMTLLREKRPKPPLPWTSPLPYLQSPCCPNILQLGQLHAPGGQRGLQRMRHRRSPRLVPPSERLLLELCWCLSPRLGRADLPHRAN